MKFYHLLCLLLPFYVMAQVKLDTTNLAIVMINTNGKVILDEPKIPADMTILWTKKNNFNTIRDTNYNYKGKIAIELRGSTSQSLSDKKPFAIELKTKSGADTTASIMNMPEESDWALLAPFSDKTMIREAIIYQLAGTVMPYAPRFQFCELILNGEYFGVYMFTEKIKRDKQRVNISKLDSAATGGDEITGGYILKLDKSTGDIPNNTSLGITSKYLNTDPMIGQSRTSYLFHYPKPEDISLKQRLYLANFLNTMNDSMASPNAKKNYQTFFDINSLVDFLIFNELSRNVDGYRLSSYLYKDKDSKDPKIKLGPLWDFNIALGNADYCDGYLTTGWAYDFNSICGGDTWTVPFWWTPIIKDTIFQSYVRGRWTNLRKNQLSSIHIDQLIDSLSTVLSIPANRNFTKWNILNQFVWPNPKIAGTYKGEVEDLKLWLHLRLVWLDKQWLIKTETHQETQHELLVYPNPSNNGFCIFSADNSLSNKFNIQIFNALGKVLIEDDFMIENGKSKPLAEHLLPGTYYLRITQNGILYQTGTWIKTIH